MVLDGKNIFVGINSEYYYSLIYSPNACTSQITNKYRPKQNEAIYLFKLTTHYIFYERSNNTKNQ